MMMTIACILALAALITGIMEAMGRCPSWVPVILLAIVALLNCLPAR